MPLRIKSLELHGYKTFAERTLFEFAEGITAIVGPNGSGKSNIADALRWVLGEQSYSLLRARRTEDMIFSGSEQRSRAGMASATVLFDNSDNWLPLEFSEVTLARRAYRDGRNEYLLNNQTVRLKDIKEILAKSGLSERTYTILGQGMVDAALALRADERRKLFEEAAGVGLYRARREEALRRLDTTLRNLDRVQDIMAELEPRLRTLERQARKAREYAQAQADLRLLLREWYGYHWHRAQKDLASARGAVREQEGRLQKARQAYQETQEKYNAFRERLQALRSQVSAWRSQLAALQSRREQIRREMAVLEERRRSLTLSQQEGEIERERLQAELQVAHERLHSAGEEVERLQQEYEDARTEAETAQAALQARQKEREQAEARYQAALQSLTNWRARLAELRARRDELQSRLENHREKLTSLERDVHEAEQALRDLEERQHRAALARQEAEKAVQKAERALEEQRARTVALEEQRRTNLEERARLEAEQDRLQNRLDVLIQAEQSLAGYAEGARFLLDAARRSRLQGVRGALSTALSVPAELETAIAAALGDYLDAVLLTSAEDVDRALDLLSGDDAGRAALLPLAHLIESSPVSPPNDPACLGVASDLVQAPDDLRPAVDLLLGQVLIARDRKSARRFVRDALPPVRVVTLRGEVFHADGMVFAGKPRGAGMLSRPRQRKELEEALSKTARKIDALNDVLRRLGEELATSRDAQHRCEEDVRAAQRLLEEAREAERTVSLEVEAARRQRTWQIEQYAQAKAEIETLEAGCRHVDEEQAEVESRVAEAREGVQRLEGAFVSLDLDEAQERVAYWRTRLAVAERALDDARARQAERRETLEGLESRLRALEERLAQTGREIKELAVKYEELAEQEGEIGAQVEALRTQIEPAEKELTEEAQIEAYQKAENEAQRALALAERLYAQAQLNLTRSQERLDALRQRIQDDFGLVQFDYEGEIAGPVPLPFEGMVEQLPVVTELPPDLEEHLKQQRAHLRRLGPVNPEAEQEYASEQARYKFLTEQMEDLRKAEADLRQVIAELDDLTQREFRKTFEAVAREFREIFTRLFGGGSARLVLTDPDNLVETGIDIEARLPGRREQGLALLSGGERSLTAIALIFALIKVSPPPVCVLDEVDAMLDEANVVRFRELLKELSKETQFLIITHNRNTVQAADVIYGVTMRRDSTSQVISLKLDEISDEMLDTYTR
ncbi:MAG: chromosome segregation protein SMC [Anaerolineae bacterium]|nr:MAG: chromosome segregation protein SMC [Anaerolineae bacterium]